MSTDTPTAFAKSQFSVNAEDRSKLIIRSSDYDGLSNPLTLDDFCPISINPDEFPTNPFFIQFFNASWNEINSIGKFYHPEAVFSISVDSCPIKSPLHRFSQYSRNILNSASPEPAIGQDNIAIIQSKLFPKGFFAYPTSMHSSILCEGLCTTVINGVFQDTEEHLFAFDRSMVVADFGGPLILNDHIFIKNSTSNKGSGLNKEELLKIRPEKAAPAAEVPHTTERGAFSAGQRGSGPRRGSYRGRGRGYR